MSISHQQCFACAIVLKLWSARSVWMRALMQIIELFASFPSPIFATDWSDSRVMFLFQFVNRTRSLCLFFAGGGLSAECDFCALRFCFACKTGGIINWEIQAAIYLDELRSSLKYFRESFNWKYPMICESQLNCIQKTSSEHVNGEVFCLRGCLCASIWYKFL